MNEIAPLPERSRGVGARSRSRGETLRRANVLLDVSRRCASKETLDGVLEVLVEMTSRELNCDRSTLFLNDRETSELYSRVAQGQLSHEIRLLNNSGLAGHVFQTGEPIIIADAYADPRFNSSIDERTGYKTESIACAPVRTVSGQIIGVMQCLNKRGGTFSLDDLDLLTQMTSQAAIALQSRQQVEQIERIRDREASFLRLVSDISSLFDLSSILERVVAETTRMLSAERATIFLHDASTGTLFSRVAAGSEINEIRFASHLGIAGIVFTSGTSMNIPYAYADLRFNPSFDKQTGFFTRSILCVPIRNKDGRVIGVTQMLNKRGGVFADEDEQRLTAFTAQIAIALENSKLFDDVRRMKDYTQSMLQSMSNGVITLDPALKVVTCNSAAGRIIGRPSTQLVGGQLEALLDADGSWVLERIAEVRGTGLSQVFPDATVVFGGNARSINLTIMPLLSEGESREIGSMLMFEDISTEKRMMSTLSRYMDPVVAARLLEADSTAVLGGTSAEATVMFSDIRSFTTLTEELGAQGTVAFLNEYFSLMVECISREGGMLDKFIGDAIMACFGLPAAHGDDPDRGVRAAIAMIDELRRWNAVRTEAGAKPVEIGIGLHTDIVVSGNIGAPKRMDYTVIGDGVNLASRLESACKTYSARILASEPLVTKLRGIYRMREVDLVVVKGKTEPVRIFEVLDYHDAESFPHLLDVVGHFGEGIARYRGADWTGAAERFQKCLSLNPGDALAGMYVERCRTMAARPAPSDWNGVWKLTEK